MPLSEGGASILQTGVGAVGNILSGVVGNIFNQKYARRQRDYEREMYQKTVDNAERFWNMENQYNSPVMQMQRLKEAGLNPNLVYGNGADAQGGNINNPSPSVSNNAGTSTNPLQGLNLGGVLSTMYNLKQQAAETDLIQQKIKSDITNQRLIAVSTALKELESNKLRLSNQFDKDTYNTRRNQLEAELSKTLADIDNTRQQTSSSRTMAAIASNANNRANQLQPGNMQKLREEIKNITANTNERKANLGLIGANTDNAKIQYIQHELDNGLKALEFGQINEWGTHTNENAFNQAVS